MKESLSFWNTGYTAPKSKEQWKKETTSVKEDIRITSFHSQEDALRLLNSGKNVFLTGGAGTGKSYVLKKFVSSCSGKNILVTAPTGIAANNIEGSTLHRTFKLPLGIISKQIIHSEEQDREAYRKKLLKHTDVCI